MSDYDSDNLSLGEPEPFQYEEGVDGLDNESMDMEVALGDDSDGADSNGDDNSAKGSHNDDDDEEMEEDYEFDPNDIQPMLKPTSLSTLSEKTLKKFMDNKNKTGVVFLSRIPPFMKPIKLRQLLSKYGEIGRIYLVPEDEKIAVRRKKYKHSRRVNFTEGWVEFLDKKVAKSVANLLNTKSIGGKKSSFYYDDIWNIKYLPRFKWNHLTEQLAYENKVREQRMKAEISKARRETKAYMHNVEKAKMIEGIEAKKRRKLDRNAADSGEQETTSTPQAPKDMGVIGQTIRRRFKQRKVIDVERNAKEGAGSSQQSKKASVLSQLFA